MSFISGALGGYADEATKRKGEGKTGLLQKAFKKKPGQGKLPTSGKQAPEEMSMPVPQFKKGGRVKKTGLAKVHKNERVLTAKQAKRYDRRTRKSKKR